jgi:PAS domain S-box-containing protein
VLLIALAPMLVIALALVLYFTLLRYGDAEEALVQRGAAMARQLGPAAEYGLFSSNIGELKRLSQAILGEPDVTGVTFYDRDGQRIASSGTTLDGGNPMDRPDGWSGRSPDGRTLFFHAKVTSVGIAFDDPFQAPETAAMNRRVLGSLTLEVSRAQLLARKLEILVVTLLSVLVMVGASAMLARRLGRDLTEPVVGVEEAVRRIRVGELNARVDPHPAGTVRALEDGINEMAAALEVARSRSDAALASSEAELRKQYEFANALLQAQSDAGVGMLIVLDGRVVYANDAALAIHGYSRDELFALADVALLLPAEERAFHLLRVANHLESGWNGGRFETALLTKGGEIRQADMVTTRLRGGGAMSARMVVIETDITERKAAQDRIAEANRELMRQKEEAERASVAKSRFLAAAGHDLRQPLHALTLFSAELDERVTTSDQHRLARQINTAVSSLGEVLDALLEVSRLQLSDMQPNPRPLALGPLLERVALNHRPAAEARRLRLRIHDGKLWAYTDSQYLARILGNLIANAVRYTRHGGIVVGARRAGQFVRVEVWDSGMGISPEHLQHLFQEFYQVGNPERDAAKGLGLGLSIVDRLARGLGTEVKVRSVPGRGSVFSILLPRAQPVVSVQREDLATKSGVLSGRVLVVGSSSTVQSSLVSLLRGWGCRVGEADSPSLLKSILESELPDLILCEDRQIAALLASLESIAIAPPVVLLGESPSEELRGRIAGRLGIPLRPARLRALVQHLLEDAAV